MLLLLLVFVARVASSAAYQVNLKNRARIQFFF
jgi:hypothetical protein